MYPNLISLRNFLLLGIIVFTCYSCKNKEKAKVNDPTKILFISHINASDIEFVVRNMVRRSNLGEYTVLSSNDTLELRGSGKSFFMLGQRNTVLDSFIIDYGSVVHVTLFNDSLVVSIDGGSNTDNLSWYKRFIYHVEDDYQELFQPTTFAEFLATPLTLTNDYAIINYSYTHPYDIDKAMYNKRKQYYDHEIKRKYLEQDSLIINSEFEKGTKILLRNALFNSTINVFRRLYEYRQEWMYNYIKDGIEQSCSLDYTTDMLNYLVDYETEKHFNRITILDLEKVYQNQLGNCLKYQQDIRRLCVYRMFIDRQSNDLVSKVFDEYVTLYTDTAFYNFIATEFGRLEYDANGASSDLAGIYVDMKDNEYTLDQILDDNKNNVVLLDFWASWCAPCREGLPHVLNLEMKYKDSGFKVIYASIDAHPNPWKKASRDEGISNNNFWSPNFSYSAEKEKYLIKNIPRYILFDKSGKLKFENAPKPQNLEEIIEGMLYD